MLDITPQKQAEELLRLANDELEMRVLTRTTELEDANEMMDLEIGERRRAEDELRAAEERLRAVIEHLPGVVYTWRVPAPDDTERTDILTYTSPQIEDLLGFTQEEWEDGRFWETRVHPHDRDRVLAATQRSRDTGVIFDEEYRYLAKDGRVVWVLDRAALLLATMKAARFAVPRRDARHHRSQAGRGEGGRGRGALPRGARGRPGRDVRVRARAG